MIIVQPRSVTVTAGQKASFQLFAVNAETYKWYYRKSPEGNWTAIKNNGNSSTYTLTAEARHNGYQFQCLVENGADSVYSKTVTLTVVSNEKPTITSQPTDVSVTVGSRAAFKVTASNADSYKWYYRKSSEGNWTAIKNNGTSATYNLTTKLRHNGYQFHCLVKNSAGSVYSNTVTLTVISNEKPTITLQPVDVSVTVGSIAAFKVAASNADSYKWYYRKSSEGNWTAIKNNGSSTACTLTTETRHNGYQFRCLVKNSAGSVYSNTVTLTVVSNVKPVITKQPTDVSVNVGGKATFKVAASNANSYKWYYRKSSSASWTAVKTNGASSAYSLTAKKGHNGYQFRCLLKNSVGSVYSKIVKLTVTDVPVTGVSLSQTKAALNIGDRLTLTASVFPSDATNQAVIWSSSNPAIAAVKDGIVIALSAGAANIIAETEDGGKTAFCRVIVVDNPEGLPLDETLCLVCMGFQLNPDGSMQQELIGRLLALKRTAEKYPFAIIVCTGGATASGNPNVTEAGQMASWLISNGIDSSRILIEGNSRTTADNAVYTLNMLSYRWPPVTHILITTSDYHMSSSVQAFQSEAMRLGSSITIMAGESYIR